MKNSSDLSWAGEVWGGRLKNGYILKPKSCTKDADGLLLGFNVPMTLKVKSGKWQ